MDVDQPVTRILEARRRTGPDRCTLVALSGIDGSGKGYLAARILERLRDAGCGAVAIGVDGWLNLPSKRFSRESQAEHFYRNAIRFQEMFSQLVLPLRDRGSIRLEADYTEETARAYRRQVYEYRDVDVILLEGIYLLKPEFRAHYDLSMWVECTFATALERALARQQEGLSPQETIRAYETIYFPAQRIHFERDDPRSAAALVMVNDPRLETPECR
jgi:uridine kinase